MIIQKPKNICCQKCGEKNAWHELSHDIPRYLGGFDCDGRHWLCVECHNKYERIILSRCFIRLFHQLLPFFDEREYSKYMIILKNSPFVREAHYIAWEVKKEWWSKDDTNSN
jgi:hypothetical protein